MLCIFIRFVLALATILFAAIALNLKKKTQKNTLIMDDY